MSGGGEEGRTGEIWNRFTVCVSPLFERFRTAHASLLTHVSLLFSLSLSLSFCVCASLIIHNPQHPHACLVFPFREGAREIARSRDRCVIFERIARREGGGGDNPVLYKVRKTYGAIQQSRIAVSNPDPETRRSPRSR